MSKTLPWCCRAGLDWLPPQAGSEKTFHLSRGAIAARWASSADDMAFALKHIAGNSRLQPLIMIRRSAAESKLAANVGA